MKMVEIDKETIMEETKTTIITKTPRKKQGSALQELKIITKLPTPSAKELYTPWSTLVMKIDKGITEIRKQLKTTVKEESYYRLKHRAEQSIKHSQHRIKKLKQELKELKKP